MAHWAHRVQETVAVNTLTELISVPSGSGPGNLQFGSRDCFVTWAVNSNAYGVPLSVPYRTGPATSATCFVSDGAVLRCQVNATANAQFDTLGRGDTGGTPAPLIWAQWYPAGASVSRCESLSWATGTGFGLETLSALGTSIPIAAPGECRYFSFRAIGDVTISVRTQSVNPVLHCNIPATDTARSVVGAWDSLQIRNVSGSSLDYLLEFSRYPIGD